MAKWIGCLALAIAVAWAAPAAAQAPEGTLEVKSERVSTEGRLFACYLQFEALLRDNVYRQGQYSLVGGSVGYTANGTMMLKVVLKDFDPALRPLPTDRPDAAYVETSDRSNNARQLLARNDAENEGGRLYIFNIDNVMLKALEQMLVGDTITVVFNRKPGGSDIRLPVDLTVASIGEDLKPIRSDAQVNDFRRCMGELLPLIEERIVRAR